MKRLISLLFILLSFSALAQDAQMADGMRADGKIYVVVTVLSIAFVCLAAYLIFIDRKLKKLEERK